MDEKELQRLYDAVHSKFDIGDFGTFKTKMQTPEDRKRFYTAVSDKGFDLGEESQFEERLSGIKKKVPQDVLPSVSEDGSQNTPTPEIPIVDISMPDDFGSTDPIELARQHNQLSNATITETHPSSMGVTVSNTPDKEKRNKAKGIEGYLKGEGINDPQKLFEETEGLTDNDFGIQGFSKEKLLADRKENPNSYLRSVGRLKWKGGIEKQLANNLIEGNISKEDYDNILGSVKSSIQSLNNNVGDYQQQRDNARNISFYIKQFGGENSGKLLKNYAAEMSKVYGNAYKTNFDKYAATAPESEWLDKEALLGYEYLKDISPEQAKQYDSLFIDPKKLKDDPDALAAYNKLMLNLKETGISLQRNAINEDLNGLGRIAKEQNGLTPEQLQTGEKLEERLKQLDTFENKMNADYPERGEDALDDATQEILGQKTGWASQIPLKTKNAVKNTVSGVWEMVSQPFMSDESNQIRELSIMGEMGEQAKDTHRTDENTAFQTSRMQFEPEFKKQLDAIKKDKSLTYGQQEDKVQELLKANKDKWGRVEIANGKLNLSPAAIVGAVTDLGTTLLPFIAVEAATGGIGGAGTAARFLRTANAAFLTGYHDHYAESLSKGLRGSDAYFNAMGMTAIDAAAMAGAGTAAQVKAFYKGKNISAAKVIEKLSDDAIEAQLKRGLSKGMKAFGQSIKERVKATPAMIGKGAKTGTEFEVAMTGGEELKSALNNEPINRQEQAKRAVLGVINFSGLASVMGHAGYKSPNELDKAYIVDIGKQPEGYTAALEKMKNEGLGKDAYEEKLSIIERATEAYKALPKYNSKGKQLTEEQKGDYILQTIAKKEHDANKVNLPPKQAEEAEHKSMVSDYKREIIIDVPTDKQLESRKNTLEKQLEQKDDTGKLVLNEKELAKAKAQLEAINDTIEDRKKYQPDTKLSEPIEGLNEQGVPVQEPSTVSSETTTPKGNTSNVGGDKSDADIEKRMAELEDKHNGIPSSLKNESDAKEYNSLEKEMEKRERATVFDVPLENVNDAVDTLLKKEKDKPNGFGAFIEKRDARETKEVTERYLNAKGLTDRELKKDFKDALFGNPTTWYADGLKLRESMKEAANRGIEINDLLNEVKSDFTKDGFDEATARKVIAGMLKPVFEGSQKVNEKQLPQSLSKQESGGKAPVTKPEGKSDVVVDRASNVGGEGKAVSSEVNEKPAIQVQPPMEVPKPIEIKVENENTEITPESNERQPTEKSAQPEATVIEGGSGTTPPKETPVVEAAKNEPEEWTAIRQAKLKEIDRVAKLYETENKTTFPEIQRQALEQVANEYPDKTLYEAVKTKTEEIAAKYDSKQDYNPTAKDLAVIQEFKRQTEKRLNSESLKERLNSDDDIVRNAALAEAEGYNNDLLNVGKAIHKREAGTAFGFRQSESRQDENYGLQIRRMEIMRAQGGEKLTPEQETFLNSQWAKEKDIMQREQSAREDIIKETFNQEIDKLKKEYEAAAKKTSGGTKNKNVANRLRGLADKVRNSDTIDKILGKGEGIEGIDTTAMGLTADKLKEAVAKVLEYMADGLDKGEAMIKSLKEVGGEKSREFSNLVDKALIMATRPDRTASFELLKEQAEKSGARELTPEMAKNVKEYINSHIGDVSQKELIEDATNSLKQILPDITKRQVMDAYLGEGLFKKQTKRDLYRALDAKKRELQKQAKNERTEDEAQKIKLEETKKKTKAEIERLNRDISEGNFEEPKPPTVLKKEDAELIRLNKEKKNLEVEFNKYKRGIEEKNKSKLERAADFVRNTYVAFLIGGMHTLEKVGAMALIRPFSEALTKQTAGRAFDAFFPNISKAAKRGGESNSIKAMTSGFGAYFRQMGEKKMQEVFEDANEAYVTANEKYETAKKDGASEKELSGLKNDMQNKLINALGKLQYQFIGGSSIKDSMKALVNRANEIEASFGGIDKESIKDGNWLDKAGYILGFIGRSHSALKTFSGRYSFAAGLMARIEAAVKGGEKMNTEKVIELAHESYLDFERGKYQQENAITRWWNTHVLGDQKDAQHPEWNNVNKAIRQVAKGDVAITRVPVNIIHEAVMEYTIGAFRAIYKAAKQKGMAKKAAAMEGLVGKDMENKIKESLANMDEKEAATIARCFRKGGIGLGLYAFSALVSFGGFQYFGQRKKKEEEDLGYDELNPGQVQIGDKKLNELESGVIAHTPAFYPLLMGKGIAYLYKKEIEKGKTTPEAAKKALMAHLKSMEGHIPQAKVISPLRVTESIFKSVEKRGEEYGLVDEEEKPESKEKSKTPQEQRKSDIQKRKKERKEAMGRRVREKQ